VKSEAKAQESTADITETTPQGYYAQLNRKPKGATQTAQPWEIYKHVSGAKPAFCCRESSKQDAEARCRKLDRMAEEERQKTPAATNSGTYSDREPSGPPLDPCAAAKTAG
jgi:hypothetical protein